MHPEAGERGHPFIQQTQAAAPPAAPADPADARHKEQPHLAAGAPDTAMLKTLLQSQVAFPVSAGWSWDSAWAL